MTFTRRMIGAHETNPIGLGCMSLSWAYGTPPSDEDGKRLLARALDLGYDHLDTARIYGDGHNETLIGEALKGRRREFFLATKMGIVIEGEKRGINCRPETIRRCIDESLTRLQTDHVDLYYMHRRDRDVPIEESVGAMADLVRAGKIGSIGLSEMSAETLRRAAKEHPIAAMQTEYSPWTRNPEIAVLDACAELGVGFVAFSPVARGLLAGGIGADGVPQGDLRGAMPRFQGDNLAHNLEMATRFGAIAEAAGCTMAQLCMAWVLSRRDFIVPIPGTTRIDHLDDLLGTFARPVPAETLAAVDALFPPNAAAGPRYAAEAQSQVDTEVWADEQLA